MIKDFIFTASDGEKLHITTHLYENLFSGNSLIFVHGFKGFKDWGFGPYLADFFAQKGFHSMLFNFSHNGIGNKPTEFTELEKFAKNTFSREIAELSELVEAVKGNFFATGSKGKIGLLGHSRGGAISILTASKRNDINAAAVWASVAKLDRYSQRQKEEWRKKGSFDVMNMRTKQVMKLNLSLLEDIEQNSNSSLNIEKAVKNLNVPLLIMHGDQDLAVPMKEGEQLYEWADKSKTELFKLFGTGHTFDITHPFRNSNPKFERLLQKTAEFFISNFK